LSHSPCDQQEAMPLSNWSKEVMKSCSTADYVQLNLLHGESTGP